MCTTCIGILVIVESTHHLDLSFVSNTTLSAAKEISRCHEPWLFPLVDDEFIDLKSKDGESENDAVDGKCLYFIAPSKKPNRVDIDHEDWADLDQAEAGENE